MAEFLRGIVTGAKKGAAAKPASEKNQWEIKKAQAEAEREKKFTELGKKIFSMYGHGNFKDEGLNRIMGDIRSINTVLKDCAVKLDEAKKAGRGSKAKFCPSCGEAVDDTMAFCGSCGAKL